MLDSESEEKKPSLEELLRVKRAERPSDDFWQQFDRELEKKIVQSMVHRDSAIQGFLRWLCLHGRGITAVTCIAMGVYFLWPTIGDPSAENLLAEKSLPARAATEALEKSDTWTSGSAPSHGNSEQNYVIEVLSSGAGPASGAGRTWLGANSQGDSGAYYVADQLSSSELGWSGERLPF